MNRYLDPYIGVLRVGIRNNLYYRADFIIGTLFTVAYAVLMIFLWTVVFTSSGQSQISGFTLQNIYAYFFLFMAFFAFAEPNIAHLMQNDVKDGTIVIGMIRPMSYLTQLFLTSLSRVFVGIVTFVLPLLIVAALVAHIPVTSYGLALSAAVVAIGFVVYGIISFLIGTLSLFMTDIYGLRYILSTLVYVVAGGVVPLSMLPQYAANIAYLLPFQTMGYLPVTIFMGIASTSAIINGIIVGCVWAAVLAVFAFFWWKRVKVRITSVGG